MCRLFANVRNMVSSRIINISPYDPNISSSNIHKIIWRLLTIIMNDQNEQFLFCLYFPQILSIKSVYSPHNKQNKNWADRKRDYFATFSIVQHCDIRHGFNLLTAYQLYRYYKLSFFLLICCFWSLCCSFHSRKIYLYSWNSDI